MHMSTKLLYALWMCMLPWVSICAAQEYAFKGGFPTPETVQQAYDDADLNRAIQAYRFFYPTVSIAAT